MLTKKAKYGLLAMSYLAKESRKRKELIQIGELAEKGNVPKKFLEIILLELKKQSIVYSSMGKKGGYQLAKPASQISVGHIIRTLDGPLASISCVSKTAYRPCDECVDEKTCEIRKVMQAVRDATAHILDGTSLEDMIRRKVNY